MVLSGLTYFILTNMDFWEALQKRHCIRDFDENKKVSNEQIKKLIIAAKTAPSAGDVQDWEFKIVKENVVKKQLVNIAWNQDFIAQASVVIVVCINFSKTDSDYGKRGIELYSIQDTAAATQNILLAATALGLGACWVGAFDEDRVKEILNLEDNLRPVVIVPVGYPK